MRVMLMTMSMTSKFVVSGSSYCHILIKFRTRFKFVVVFFFFAVEPPAISLRLSVLRLHSPIFIVRPFV